MDNFDRSMNRKLTFMFAIAGVWILFLIGAGSTIIWLLGRWIGAW